MTSGDRHRQEPLEESVPCSWVVPDPHQYVENDGVRGVDEQFVVG